MIYLTSGRLRVEISEPGECPNDRFRFDRSGFLSEVTLDGAVHFCANEPSNLAHPSTGGRGLCSEFTADYSSEVQEGEYYPKLGIGLIKKEGPYCFCHRYRQVEEFPVSMACGENWAEFVTEPVSCLGYAVRTVRRVSVEGPVLTMETLMENVGEREIVTGEYCHNFLSIDGMAISPDYRLDLPGLKGLERGRLANQYPTLSNFVAREGGVDFARCETLVSLSSIPLDGFDGAMPFIWRLSHKGAKAWVEGRDYLRPSEITLWAADHIVSPEIIQTISVKPGERASWKRTWTFEAER